jgi:PAS domain S-box-containing protein
MNPRPARDDPDALRAQNTELRLRLQEADETLQAIRHGDVDALVVENEIYTLESAGDASNRLRKDVLAQMDDAVLAFDLNERIIFMNAAAERQYGVAASSCLGLLKHELYREEIPAREGAPAPVSDGTQEPQATRSFSTHHCLGGAVIQVETTLSPLRDGGRELVGSLVVIRDVTEQERAVAARKLAEESLRNADRRKDEFLATLAHELRNPLAPIRNALQIMRLTNEASAIDNARGVIERQLGQLVHLVDDLLDVNRISQGKIELRKVDVDIAAVVRDAIETSRPLIEAGRHTLTVRLPAAASAIVNADPTRVGQVVANLLNNAAKYTPDGGHIEVCARAESGEAVITVSDDGVGISAEMLPRVFEMFAQVDHTVSRSQGGLGIGLTLVKRLVEMHGGTVQAESGGPGHGCIFTVRIPLAQGRVGAAAADVVAHSTQGLHRRILVVDDSHDIATSTADLLAILGHETFIAHDGEEAVALVKSVKPSVVLLDIGLPKRSGHEVAKWIRAQPGGADLLLIALSGWGQKEDVRKSREAGFDMHLVKPVELDTLSEIISRRR